jgi:hypothetical protein
MSPLVGFGSQWSIDALNTVDPQVRTIKLSHVTHLAGHIDRLIPWVPQLTRLILRDCQLNETDIRALCTAIGQAPNLIVLELSGLPFNTANMTPLIACLTNIRRLSLANSNWEVEHNMLPLIEALSTLRIESLNLSRNLLSSEEITALAHQIKITKTLTELDLNHNSPWGVMRAHDELFAALAVNQTITKFVFNNNYLDNLNQQAICRWIASTKTLRSVDFSWCDLYHWIKPLTTALISNQSIRTCILDGWIMCNPPVGDLCRLITNQSTITELLIGRCATGMNIFQLARAVGASQLTSFTCTADTQFTYEDEINLLSIIGNNPYLSKLTVGFKHIEIDAAQRFAHEQRQAFRLRNMSALRGRVQESSPLSLLPWDGTLVKTICQLANVPECYVR